MFFTPLYAELKSVFSLGKTETDIPLSDISIRMLEFISAGKQMPFDTSAGKAAIPGFYPSPDSEMNENSRFFYPVFVPGKRKKYQHPILLLHGLNERSWLKYLPWAYYLCQQTGRPVILFPIAFHINRSPDAWANPHAMLPLLNQRKCGLSPTDAATFVNVALSERLSDNPLRFFTSGKQSADDIVSLVSQIRKGEHPLFEKGSETDIFAYSIGAFLAQIIMLANPSELFSNTKLFMFCGGSVFSAMNGVSKLIMDKPAFDNIYKFYLHDIDDEIKQKSPFSDCLRKNPLGYAFHSMIDFKNHRSFRDNRFHEMRQRIQAVVLKNDKVIPAVETMLTLSGNAVMLDFPYDYTHETPFPTANPALAQRVDYSFENVFSRAAAFLS